VATIAVNDADNIQFVNVTAGQEKEKPTLIIQAGDWDSGGSTEPGIVFDVFGSQAPILTANDARKLAKWLVRAADSLDGFKTNDKKRKPKNHHYETDEDEYDKYS
jgi:hypothetical protein